MSDLPIDGPPGPAPTAPVTSATGFPRLETETVERYEHCLFRVWLRCQNNALPSEIAGFDENRDPMEALAELSVDKELKQLADAKPVSAVMPPPGPEHKKAS